MVAEMGFMPVIGNVYNVPPVVSPVRLPPTVIPVWKMRTPEMVLKWAALVRGASMMMERMWSAQSAVWSVKPAKPLPLTASSAGRVATSRKWAPPADALLDTTCSKPKPSPPASCATRVA